MELVLALSHLRGTSLGESVNAEVLGDEGLRQARHAIGRLELVAVHRWHKVRALEAANSKRQCGGVEGHLQVHLDLACERLSDRE